MTQERYRELMRITEERDNITTSEYLEIMSYEQPAYYKKLIKAYKYWDEIDQEELEQIIDELSPQDAELVLEQINPDYY